MTEQESTTERSAAVASQALQELARTHPELAELLAGLTAVMANEATRSSRFAGALERALQLNGPPARAAAGRRFGRRSPGILDPFAVYAEHGDSGLRRRLAELDLEQLRDIVAEHGMDHDRLAMKWKDPRRVIERIVERVAARVTKGSAFRQA